MPIHLEITLPLYCAWGKFFREGVGFQLEQPNLCHSQFSVMKVEVRFLKLSTYQHINHAKMFYLLFLYIFTKKFPVLETLFK